MYKSIKGKQMRTPRIYETENFPATRMQLVVGCTKVLYDEESGTVFFSAITVTGNSIRSYDFNIVEKAEQEREKFMNALRHENKMAHKESRELLVKNIRNKQRGY
jgi:endoglucanase Acf2